ncbi:MAG: hypothetical protein CBE16_00120 [Rhodospirillaceae bacterium TMED256]|nr:MAG: hypothetical protein CBE16_00120 [Rhodospirillaceae bacterium TMED256]
MVIVLPMIVLSTHQGSHYHSNSLAQFIVLSPLRMALYTYVTEALTESKFFDRMALTLKKHKLQP